MIGSKRAMNDRVLVDTSVWIAFFRNMDSDVSVQLKQLLKSGRPVYSGIIATELYRGAKSKKETAALDELLTVIECVETKEEYFFAAGRLGHILTQNGITVGTVDLLVAQIALANNLMLFTLDKHFPAIARYSSLRLYPNS
jgi:predicted nucleic acid-binding protein